MFTDTKSALLYVLFCAVIPYLLGSLSFSIIVSRLLFRKDVRNYGSHNAGMTNVLRTFGKGAAALTLAGDIGKGVAAVLLAKWFFSAHLNDAIYYRGAIIGVYLAAFFAVIIMVCPSLTVFWFSSVASNKSNLPYRCIFEFIFMVV